MALSGSVDTSKYDGRYYQLSWKATQSITDNKSTISWTLKAVGGNSSWYSERTLTVYIGGTKVYSKDNRVERYTGTIKTGTLDLNHNSMGEKSFDVSVNAAVYGTAVNCKGSGSFTLNDIARASTITASNGTLGTQQSLTINSKAVGFSHAMMYTCGTAEGVILPKTLHTSTSTTVRFTPPLDLAKQNLTGTSVSVTLTLITYNGNTDVGTTTKTITCAMPASIKPTCGLAITDATGKKSIYGKAIKGISKLTISANGTTSMDSPIASLKITANGETYTTSPVTTGVLKAAGSILINAQVTDKRGRSGTASKNEAVYDYEPPVISKLSVKRCNSDGTENAQGAYIQATISGSYTSLDNQNSATYVLRYKKTTESSYTTVNSSTLAAYGITGNVTDGTYVFSASTESSYDIVVEITDKFQTVKRVTSASTAFTIIDFKANGKGIGFGKVSELDDLVDFGFRIRTNGGILQPVLEPNTNLDDIKTPNTYTLRSKNSANYTNSPIEQSATGTLKVESCGIEGQVRQVVTVCHKTDFKEYERYFYQSAWGAWKRKYDVVLYDNTSGSSSTITLSESAANFTYIEIFFTDNKDKTGGYTKVYSPDGKTVCLSIVEASGNTITYIRRAIYDVSGTTLTPSKGNYLTMSSATLSHNATASNLIKIIRVIGHD